MRLFITTLALGFSALLPATVQAEKKQHPYISLEAELKHATAKGIQYLKATQDPKGFWGNETITAYTALAIYNIARDPARDAKAPLPDYVVKGLDWIVSQQKDDGGIYGKGLANYNTSASIMALLAGGRPQDEKVIVQARRFLVNQQSDFDNRGETDNKYDGGIGYGGTYAHSDLSNTHLSLQAIKASEHLIKDGRNGKQPDLDWDAAIQFVSRCQNLEETNDQAFASSDPDNKGGFVYFPGSTKAGEQKLKNGRVALRSYGSISYAGLLSLAVSDLSPTDKRVVAVTEWLGRNYTIEENPGMGAQGLFYYYQAMSKALTAANIDELTLPDGKKADWRRDLARKLITSQKADGSWVNENSRWFESDAALVTSYSLTSLINIQNSILQIK